jgi:hypothetical protein
VTVVTVENIYIGKKDFLSLLDLLLGFGDQFIGDAVRGPSHRHIVTNPVIPAGLL